MIDGAKRKLSPLYDDKYIKKPRLQSMKKYSSNTPKSTIKRSIGRPPKSSIKRSIGRLPKSTTIKKSSSNTPKSSIKRSIGSLPKSTTIKKSSIKQSRGKPPKSTTIEKSSSRSKLKTINELSSSVKKSALSELSSMSYISKSPFKTKIENRIDKPQMTMKYFADKHHNNIIPNLQNLLIDVDKDIYFDNTINDTYCSRIFKSDDITYGNTRYITIIYYKKNMKYLYKYISYILNSQNIYPENIYIFNIICDNITYNKLLNDKESYMDSKPFTTSYETLETIINKDVRIEIKNKIIIDLYSWKDKLMLGIGCKRAFANKLFTDRNDFNNDFSMLILDDNISSIIDREKCIKIDEKCAKNPKNIRYIGSKSDKIEKLSQMCIPIKDLYEEMLIKISKNENCYILGILKGRAEGNVEINDEENNEIDITSEPKKSFALYKLLLIKIFKIKEKNVYYYPYFSRCCEDRVYNALVSEHCYRLNKYKLRFAHFNSEGDPLIDNEDHFKKEKKEDYEYEDEDIPSAKMYYNKILKYLIDLRKVLTDNNFKVIDFTEDYFSNIKINNKEIIGISKSSLCSEVGRVTTKYTNYQIVIIIIYYLFGYGCDPYNTKLRYEKYKGSIALIDPLFAYVRTLFDKNVDMCNPKFLEKFASDIYIYS